MSEMKTMKRLVCAICGVALPAHLAGEPDVLLMAKDVGLRVFVKV